MHLHPLAVSLCGCCPQRDADRPSTVNLRTLPDTGGASRRSSSVVRCRPSNPRTIFALCPTLAVLPVGHSPSRDAAHRIHGQSPHSASACRRSSTVTRCRPSNPRTISALCQSLAVLADGHPPQRDADRPSTVNLRATDLPLHQSPCTAQRPVTGGACRRPSTVVRCRPSNPRTISALCPTLAVLPVGHSPSRDAAHRIHGQSPHSARHWRCFSTAIHRGEMPPIQSTDNLRTPDSCMLIQWTQC
jgi:hypothetical protein